MTSESKIPAFSSPLPVDLFLCSSVNSYIYDDLNRFEHAFLSYLEEMDYNFDKPVALSAQTSDELVFIIASCWRLGIPFVPMDPGLAQEKQVQMLHHLDAGLIIGENISTDLLDSSLNAVDIDRFSLSNILQTDFQPEELTGTAKWKRTIRPHHVFGYFFTSGTTGTPKIVPLKRRQMLFAAKASAQNLRPRRNHLWGLSLPLHHIGGISVILRSLLYGSGIYRTNGFDARETARLLNKDQRLEAVSLVPTMLNRLMEYPDFSVQENFQAILLGGGPIAPSLIEECFNRGIPVIASYGMTESCAQITANPLMTVGDLSRPKKSAGRIFTPNSIEIRNKDGIAAETSDPGRIWLKGPQLFDGYLKRNNSFYFDEHGWFNTGDYGYLNDRGELFIQARRTDLIISGGENISPAEVEHAIRNLPYIRDAAVVGVPDREWGQKVAAIVTADGDIQNTNIQRELKSQLQPFKIPKNIVIVDSIPRTATGKIRYNKVKEYFTE